MKPARRGPEREANYIRSFPNKHLISRNQDTGSKLCSSVMALTGFYFSGQIRPLLMTLSFMNNFNGVFLQRDAKVHLNLNWPTVYLELS